MITYSDEIKQARLNGMFGMTDRELLEKAAKAAGIEVIRWHRMYEPSPDSVDMAVCKNHGGEEFWWNPLVDDGYALRLAVKLELRIYATGHGRYADHPMLPADMSPCREDGREDPLSATRRAIVRAAAALAP